MENKTLQAYYTMGQHSLIDFSILTDRNYDPSWFHEALAKELEAVERGEVKRLIIECPPRHGKSQLSTINFPAWYIGKHPDREIITASYNADLAQDFGAKTRDLVNQEEFKAIFPSISLKEDTQSKAKWATNMKGSYTSVGVGGSLTGRGADLLIIDDPIKNREEADSEVIREKIWDWYTSTARTRLEKDAAIVIIMTRWHLDDLVGRLKERAQLGGLPWKVVTFPAIATVQEKHRNIGEALWPEKYDIASLNEIMHDLDARDWLALFQQSPIASESQDFKQEYFKTYEAETIEHRTIDAYIGVDLAISKKTTADNTSITVIGKDRNGPNIYILDRITGKLDPLQTINAIFSLVEQFNPVRVGIETVQYQEALKFFIEEEQRKRQVYFSITGLTHKDASKETRIRSLVPMYKAGVIHHRHADKDLEHQLLLFPQGKHDDEIDSLQMAINVLQPTEIKTPKTRVRQLIESGELGTY